MARVSTGWRYLDDAPRLGGLLVFAHRGGASHPDLVGRENTLTAFRHAAALGFALLETDVHTTRDGVLVAFHDDVLDRVTDRTGALADLTLAEVREAVVGGSERVPTLAELVEAFPRARFNIDLKSDGAVAALADFVLERDLADRVLVGSFDPRRIRRFRRLTRHRVATAADPLEVAAFVACPSARLAARLAPGFAALQVPERRGPLRVVTAGLVRRAHATGRHVHVWTVDDAEEARRLRDLGVDGLFTDRCDVLVEALARP